MSYRPDVDGLRAIAILAVVIYHAHESLLPGGFIGVDVFFVISGYLITRLVDGDIRKGKFSIAGFYVRRTKRIFPALFVTLFSTLALGWYFLTPGDLAELGRTTAATAAFISNIVFWQDTGYFDVAAERKLLLHTWSLAIEEQFYVFWPIALFLLARIRANLRLVVPATIAVSFALSCYAVVRHPPSAFFLLPARGWELLLGAALALGLVPAAPGRRTRDVAGIVGLGLICIGLLALDRGSAFPGWNALFPCLGTALLIWAGEGGENLVGQHLLVRKPMVFVGLISYSLYLWHWPLLSLARITERGTLSPGRALVVVVVAFGLSVLTWRLVEQPLRAKRHTPAARPVLLRYAVVSVAAFAAGAAVHEANGFVRFASPEIVRAESARYDGNPMSGACLRWQGESGPIPGDRCMTGQNKFQRTLVIWGDSHADAASPGIVQYATARGYATHQLTMAACPPLAGVEVAGPGVNYAPCTAFNRQVLKYVLEQPSVGAVMLVARWTLYTENARFGADDPGPITYLLDAQDTDLSSETSKRVFTRALRSTVSELRRAGKAVIVLGTIPPLGINVPECLARNHMPFSGIRDCSVDASAVLPHLEFADSEIERLGKTEPGVCSFMPKRVLCPNGRCLDRSGAEILYANDDHVSTRGAAFLAQHFNFDNCLALNNPSQVARH